MKSAIDLGDTFFEAASSRVSAPSVLESVFTQYACANEKNERMNEQKKKRKNERTNERTAERTWRVVITTHRMNECKRE